MNQKQRTWRLQRVWRKGRGMDFSMAIKGRGRAVLRHRRIIVTVILMSCSWWGASAQQTTVADATAPSGGFNALLLADRDSSSTQPKESRSFGETLGTIGKTIGGDEWHFIKAPFKKSAIKWDILMVGATTALIATDERVLHQVPTSWHQTSINISDATLYATAATAGGIYLTGLVTKNEHAQETGIRTAEATVDSVIMYGAMKAILQRQRPFTGAGEGRFFSGNWTNGSFPSGHAMFTWTIASTVAHQYHSLPLDLLLYGLATTVSTTRVTAGQHFPSDVLVGSVFGYLIGDYVAHKPESGFPIRRASRLQHVRNAVLEHVAIGIE
jgi:hypothetical protein